MDLIPQNMYILDQDLGYIGTLTRFESLDVVWRFATLGEFTMVLSRDNFAVNYLEDNTFIWLSAERVLWVKHIDDEKGGQDRITVKGFTAKDIPKTRITDPRWYPATVAGTGGYYKYTSAYIDHIINDLIDKFCCSGPTGYEAFQMDNVSVSADADIGPQIDFTTRLKNVFDEISSLCITNELGLVATIEPTFAVEGDPPTFACVFEVREGTDLSGSQRFSVDNGRLLNYNHTKDYRSSANCIVAGGQGEGLARTIRSTSVPATGLGNSVVFVDMRDLATNGEIDSRLLEKQAEFAAINTFECETNVGQSRLYDDYQLGDHIYVESLAERRQITGVREQFATGQAPAISFELGYGGNLYADAIKRISGELENELAI